MEVETRRYEFSHGKRPSGRGSWAFTFDRNPEPFWVPGVKTYGEAKREAVAEAKRRGAFSVEVCS